MSKVILVNTIYVTIINRYIYAYYYNYHKIINNIKQTNENK